MSAVLTLASGKRQSPLWKLSLVSVLSSYLVLYHIYIGLYGAPTNAVFLPVHLLIALALVFLLYPLAAGAGKAKALLQAIDGACVASCAVLLVYFLSILDTWQELYASLGALDFALGALLVVLVLESVRRTVGWSMVVLALFFCVHALFADHFPGVFYGPPVSVESLMQTLVVGDAGIFGIPLLVVAQYIVLFLLFGRLLQAAGAGAFFTRLAFAIFGHRVGGPAKAGVVASGLFGTLSGSGVSNVLTTGAFTIPMMRRLGYRAPFAGGVEAAAAVGGSIMPPVMGAVAFMMAEFMGVDYAEVVVAAAIPAVLYYVAIYWTVHFEARKNGLPRLSKSAMPSPWRIVLRHGYLAIPLVMIAVMLLLGYSIILVALVTSFGTFLLSFASPSTRLSPSRLAECMEATARATCGLSATCACAGIIIGGIFATGLSFQIAQLVLSLAQDQLWLILVIAGLISLILGTGLTASAIYITMVATVIPILKQSGVPEMAAHMFAFYYGVVSDITPPTALAAVAAAGLAGSNPMKTMLEASRLGIAAFIVPLVFVFQPALLMIGSPLEIVTATVAASAGLVLLAAALTGFLRVPLDPIRRIALAVAAVLLFLGTLETNLVGVALAAAILAWDLLPGRRQASAARAVADDDGGAREASGMLGRWLAKRVAREQADAAREIEIEGGGQFLPQANELEMWLKDERVSSEAAAPDIRRWSAWTVIAVAAIAIGYLGTNSMHSTQPIAWLLSLFGLSVWLVAGLALTLRAPLRLKEMSAGEARV